MNITLFGSVVGSPSFFNSIFIKPKRFYICQSRMALWLSLILMRIRVGEQRSPTRQEEMRAIKDYPDMDAWSCKCRDCRLIAYNLAIAAAWCCHAAKRV